MIGTVFSPDFWTIRLPEDFVTSSTSASPAYQAYLAALNILDADLFALTEKVGDWMDPSANTVKGVEGNHLFPRAHLRDLDITNTKLVNQVANFAPTDWATNNLISDRAPSDYWPELAAARSLTGSTLANQQFWHALPEGWEALSYEEFLVARRQLMAQVVKAGFGRLEDPNYQPEVPGTEPEAPDEPVITDLTTIELFAAGLLKAGDLPTTADPEDDTIAEMLPPGESEPSD